MAAKVSKTFRIDQGTHNRVLALSEEGEKPTATYLRVIDAGLEALEGKETADTAEEPVEEPAADQDAVNEPTGATTALLRTIDALTAQLEAKDAQIRDLSALCADAQTIAKQQQTLQAISAKPRGLFARLFGNSEE